MAKVTTETKRWIQNPADEKAVTEGCYFDERAAEKVREFCRRFLRHFEGKWAGKPFELLDWQWERVVGPIFGWKLPSGKRRIRQVFVEVSKKNGKSGLCSALGLYLLVGDQEPGANIYSLGVDEKQASIVHGAAVKMAEASPQLSRFLQIYDSAVDRVIKFPSLNAKYEALSGSLKTANKEGFNLHAAICDEVHVWPGRALWNAIQYGGRAREQSLVLAISTAGGGRDGVWWDLDRYARAWERGDIDDLTFWGVVYAADHEDDPFSEETWRKANPSFGTIIDPVQFRSECQRASRKPAEWADWLRYSLNICVGGTNPWLNINDWMECDQGFVEEELIGMVCFAGLDLSRSTDMSSLVLVFPWDVDSARVVPYFWLPSETIEDPVNPEEWRVWARTGDLEVCPGPVIRYEQIVERLEEVADKFQLQKVFYDPLNAEPIRQRCESLGIECDQFLQRLTWFNEPCKELERLIESKRIQHASHPVLNWQIGHVQTYSDSNNNLRPVKPKKGDVKKIDGVVSMLMGLAGTLSDEGFADYEYGDLRS